MWSSSALRRLCSVSGCYYTEAIDHAALLTWNAERSAESSSNHPSLYTYIDSAPGVPLSANRRGRPYTFDKHARFPASFSFCIRASFSTAVVDRKRTTHGRMSTIDSGDGVDDESGGGVMIVFTTERDKLGQAADAMTYTTQALRSHRLIVEEHSAYPKTTQPRCV